MSNATYIDTEIVLIISQRLELSGLLWGTGELASHALHINRLVRHGPHSLPEWFQPIATDSVKPDSQLTDYSLFCLKLLQSSHLYYTHRPSLQGYFPVYVGLT